MTRWSFVPAPLLKSSHFRRRLRIIDRISLTAAFTSTAVALALSSALGDAAWTVALYAALPVIALALASLIALALRVRVVGTLAKIPSSLVPLRAQHLARTWWIMRMGLAGAMVCLIVLLVICFVAGWGGQLLFWTLMYVVFMSMIGTGIISIATDAAIIARHRASRAP